MPQDVAKKIALTTLSATKKTNFAVLDVYYSGSLRPYGKERDFSACWPLFFALLPEKLCALAAWGEHVKIRLLLL